MAIGTSDGIDRTAGADASRTEFSVWGSHPAGPLLVIAFLLGAAVFGLLQTNWARDWVKPPKGKAPYSLGQTQLYVWVATAAVSTISGWWITQEWVFPGGLLAALGIGASTTLGSRVIDRSNWGPLLEKYRDDLAVQLKAAESGDNAAEAARLRIEDSQARNCVHPKAPASEGFLRDILTGVDGDALYRYQLVLWTSVIVVQYWLTFLTRLEISDLESTQLALMGLSAGTYVGLKMPEKPQV